MDDVSFIAVKRWIFKIFLFLILGAIVNVALAWACAIALPLDTQTGPSKRNIKTGDHVPFWVVKQLKRSCAMRYVWTHVVFYFDDMFDSILPYSMYEPVDHADIAKWSLLDYSKPAQEYHEMWSVFIEDARGWPLLSMSSFTAVGIDIEKDALLFETSGGFSVPDSFRSKPLFEEIEEEWFNRPIIPLRPIWPNFMINTIFYASIVWLLTLGPFAARRYIRNKRGLCIKCGYDLRGISEAGCPECGWERETEA